jgi:hypothetical protein
MNMTTQELILAVQNGLKFEPMSDFDRNAFAGAPKDSLIASSDVAVYILSDNQLSVITEDFETQYTLETTFEIEL